MSGIVALDHVQLAMPPSGEEAADRFYAGVLGLEVVPKPPVLAARGGRWYVAPGSGVQLHLGVDTDFRPATRAHPALRVAGLDEVAERIVAAGLQWRWDEELVGARRGYAEDPFGNRIELIDASQSG